MDNAKRLKPLVNKESFLSAYDFPPEWEAWSFYPDALFRAQKKLLVDAETISV